MSWENLSLWKIISPTSAFLCLVSDYKWFKSYEHVCLLSCCLQWVTLRHSSSLPQAGASPHVMLPANQIRMSPQSLLVTQCFHLRLFHRYVIAIDCISFKSDLWCRKRNKNRSNRGRCPKCKVQR